MVKKKDEYRQLKTKITFITLCMIFLAIFSIYVIYGVLLAGRFANTIVSFLDYFIYHDYDTALSVYRDIFRNNFELFVLMAVAIMFLLILRVYLNSFTKYFNEINKGIDSLVEESANEVALSPELVATEKKINYIKHTLERRKMAAQVAEQKKNDLVMYLAHDIRTPLTSVIGYLNLLSEVPDMPTEQKTKYLDVILDKAYRLEKMIDEFFEITRYNLQEMNIVKEKIDLYYMLVQLTDELSSVLSANENTTLINVNEDLTIYGDPDKLARVFNNVLKNAAHYSYSKTEIIISAEEKGNQIIISFINKGRIIPEQKLSALFERFYRLDSARSSNTGGTGLGLAIAKEIVTLHGGTIIAESESETIEFVVTLPSEN